MVSLKILTAVFFQKGLVRSAGFTNPQGHRARPYFFIATPSCPGERLNKLGHLGDFISTIHQARNRDVIVPKFRKVI